MPSKLPPRELAIGRRLREFRESSFVERTAMARAVGIQADRLVSYEIGRAPLKWGIFLKIWAWFALHPRWLATGKGFKQLEFRGFENLIKDIDPRALFSEAYDSRIAEILSKERFVVVTPVAMIGSLLDAHYQGFKGGGPLPDWAPEGSGMEKLATAERERPNSDCKVLPNTSSDVSWPSVTAEPGEFWAALRSRLERATSARGSKSALAELMNVSRATVTEWLAGASAPTADNTLRLLRWVEERERENKYPARVTARAGRKTQAGKSSEEKPDSGPPKK